MPEIHCPLIVTHPPVISEELNNQWRLFSTNMAERRGHKSFHLERSKKYSYLKPKGLLQPLSAAWLFKIIPLLSRDLFKNRFSQLALSNAWVRTAGFCPQCTKTMSAKCAMKECQRGLMAQVTRPVCRMSPCHLCTLYSLLTISRGTLLSETSDLLQTAKQKAPKYWRIRKMNASNCLHSLKREMWNKVFFSHKNMQSKDSIIFCEKLYSFQNPWKSIIHCILILQTIYSIWKHD